MAVTHLKIKKADAARPATDEDTFAEIPEPIESIEDAGDVPANTISQATVTGTDWTTETILSQINKGNIVLNPDFQRRDAWDKARKSRFIESLFLGLPIPQIVLAESKKRKGSYIVIDGKQRLLSIRQFAALPGDSDYEQLSLKELNLRADLNGFTLESLQNDGTKFQDISQFENQTIRTVVIKNWGKESFLYQVFLRLNTGSVPLSPQELRQALHPGRFVTFADSYSGQSSALRKILKLEKPDFRMRDTELLVRYYAFTFFLQEYAGDLKQFLDTTCETLNEQWDQRLSAIKISADEFENAYNVAAQVFGEKNVFRKWTGSSYESRFNRAIFDVVMFYFRKKEIRTRAQTRGKAVEAAFKNLCVENAEFLNAIERTTKSLEATSARLRIWGKALNTQLGIKGPIAKLEKGRITLI
jgi:hypothetical protein